MCALRNKISKRFSSSKSLLDTQIYKYNELKDNWIIYQGNLQYLYNTNILGDSLCMFSTEKMFCFIKICFFIY